MVLAKQIVKETWTDHARANRKSDAVQLDFGLPSSRRERFYKVRRFFKNIEIHFTDIPFWRSGTVWATIIMIIGTVTAILVLIGKFYADLPPEIPIIYDTVAEKWNSYPKISLFAIPAWLTLIGLLNIYLLRKVYYMNKRLCLMICILIIIAYSLEFIAVNELIILSVS